MRQVHFNMIERNGKVETQLETSAVSPKDLARIADICLRVLIEDLRVSANLRERAGQARLALGMAALAGPLTASIPMIDQKGAP